jgi:hypothetical protein
MMVTAVRTEPTFRAEPPALLFESTLPIASYNWDIMLDGQRFVVVLSDEEEPEPEQIVIIPDFASELEQRVRAVRR